MEIDTLEELQLLTIKEQLLYDIEAKDSLGCSEHETVSFRSWEKQQDKEQNYSHRLQMRPAWQDLWEVALESRGPEELANLQGQLPQSIRAAIRMFRQLSSCGRKPAWRTWSS